MRIVMIEPGGQRGIIQYTYSLSKALAESGHEVLLITGQNHETANLPRTFAVQEIFNRFRTNPLQVGRVLVNLRKLKPEVIHLQGALHPVMYVALFLAIRFLVNTKLIYTAHEIVPKTYHWYHHLFLSILYRLVDSVIVHTRHSREALLKLFSTPPGKCHIVPLGNYTFLEDLPEYTRLGVGNSENGQKGVLFFGIIEERKGLMFLLQAFSQVKKAIPEAKLIIAGQPFEPVDKYRQAIRTLGLEQEQTVTVNFGYIPITQIANYFQAAELVILPYIDTTQSAVVQVAYAFGKPVVATRCGGLPESIEEGRSGLLVPPRNAPALAEAMIKLLRDDDLRYQMGQYGRHLAETKYSWAHIAQEIQDIYDQNP